MPSLYSIIRGMLFEVLAEENPQRTVGDTYKIVDAAMREHEIRTRILECLQEKEEFDA